MSRFEIYDKRQKTFFKVEHDEYDLLSKYEYLVYSYLLRYANSKSGTAYMTGRACCKKNEITGRTYAKAMNSLIERGFVKHISTRPGNIRVYEIIGVPIDSKSSLTPEQNYIDPKAKVDMPESKQTRSIKQDKLNNTYKQTQRPSAAKADALRVIEKYNSVFNKNIKLTSTRFTKIKSTLKDHSLDTLLAAIEGMKNDGWSQKTGRIQIERLIDPGKRDRNIDEFANMEKKTQAMGYQELQDYLKEREEYYARLSEENENGD